MSARAVWLAAALGASLAAAQDRPSEESMFGSATPDSPPDGGEAPSNGPGEGALRPRESELFGAPAGPPDGGSGPLSPAEEAAAAASSRDEAQLFGPAAQNRFETREEQEDPLRVGGTLYLRAVVSPAEGKRLQDVGLTAPSLMDGYFDARPSDRVRGMMLARLQYDPTRVAGASALPVPLPGAAPPANPSVDLDQLWIRFDVARTLFVTAGKQHVKWGASRFWNPTDFLTPTRKDPLAAFDVRLGATMLKVHLPWESKGWNFYAVGLLDNTGPANTLGQLGGAARAEVVLGSTEVGADAVFVGGRSPRFGLDLSSALGPIDVYGEMALRRGSDFQVWRFNRAVDWSNPADALLALEGNTPEGLVAQTSAGLTWTFNYTEKNALTVGAEYYYNPVGADSRALYPWLLFQNQFQPFYVGQHYAAVYALAPGLPGDLSNVTLSLVNIGNLSDRSFVTRLDAFVRVLSYLSIELYAAGHYGAKGGEFRFALDLPPIAVAPDQVTPPINVPAPLFEVGAGLRVSL